MPVDTSSPWHRESYDRFLQERLPELLAERLPLAGYTVEPAGTHTCRVSVVLAPASGEVPLQFDEVPQPDAEGLFWLDGRPRVVVPIASQEELEVAQIRCVGEQLYELFARRLGPAHEALPWTQELASAWLPLDAWIREFLRETGQPLDTTNALSRITHRRRLLIPSRDRAVLPGQFGRVCPFEVPEGPNIGRVFSIAVGAGVRDGRLVVVDERPEAGLGATACMVPFLEHSGSNRVLMGVNMMRQWMPPADPEPALVQTGAELGLPEFWGGRSLLTAFVSLGGDTYEDGIVISESCARRLDYPQPVEPGDKLSNRHGTKGVISRIVPDDEMPHLSDGTPVELVFSFIGLHTRLNFGQIREAVMGRIAHAEGSPAVVPPLHAPSEAELRERLRRAGLPENGMETLTLGREGPKLGMPSTVGWVYWGRTVHVAREKLHASAGPNRCNRWSDMEYYALREAGALETIRETYNTRAMERPDAGELPARVAAGPVPQAGPPAPAFAEVARRLAVAGVRADLDRERLLLRLAPPEGDVLKLAGPARHPWLSERELAEVGALPGLPQYEAVAQANSRLERTLASRAPAGLAERAAADLEQRIGELLSVLLTPEHLRFGGRVLFSGRTVIAPGPGLRLDQVALADEIAWTLFAPAVTRELGDAGEAAARTDRAARALDEVMARSWVLVNRAPTTGPTGIVAFHPVRDPGRVIRLHPLACPWLNADFDGDQVALFLPITEEGQREAGEKLSVAGHLARDPGLLQGLLPRHEALWGLAWLSLTPEGRAEVERAAGVPVSFAEGYLTQDALHAAMRVLLARDGIAKTLETLDRLMHHGLGVAKASGASLHPFAGSAMVRPPMPTGEDCQAWSAWATEFADAIAARGDFANPDLGPQLLAVKSGARGQLRPLSMLLGAFGCIVDANGGLMPVRHGRVEGLSATEALTWVVGARQGLIRMSEEWAQAGRERRIQAGPKSFHVLARAMRAEHPGIVFARAAATGEVDPLTDTDSRLFVGLPAC